jgi:branched-chain amino acid transport system substrate-binding protein
MKSSRRFTIWPILGLILVGLLIGSCSPNVENLCEDPLGCVPLQPGDAIRLAYLLNFSGSQLELNQDIYDGIQLAINDSQGSLLGHPIDLTGVDTGCTKYEQQLAANQISLIHQIVAVIGPGCPTNFEPAVHTLDNAGLTTLSVGLLPPHFSMDELDQSPGDFRLASDPERQGQVTALFAFTQLQAKRAVVITDESPYSTETGQAFSKYFTLQGGKVIIQETLHNDNDLQVFLNTPHETADVIYFPLYESAGDQIILHYHDPEQPAISQPVLATGEGRLDRTLIKNTGKSAQGIYLVGLDMSEQSIQAFTSKWSSAYYQQPINPYALYAYDATRILLDAIRRAAKNTIGGDLLINRQGLREALATVQDYAGFSGQISCSPAGDCVSRSLIGVYVIDRSVINGSRWPPPLVWKLEPE